jgi:hypothetical protein
MPTLNPLFGKPRACEPVALHYKILITYVRNATFFFYDLLLYFGGINCAPRYYNLQISSINFPLFIYSRD